MYTRKTPIKSDCPIEKTLNVISGKWKPAILNELFKTKLRLKDIQKGIPEASKRALTQQLNEMIHDGLIEKEDFEMPFVESANYLGMKYIGSIHSWLENDSIPSHVKRNLNGFIDEKLYKL